MTVKCKKINKLVNLSIDDAISEKDDQKLKEHLAVCEKCRDDFNALKYVISLAKEVEEKDPPADLKISVINQIRRLDFERKVKQEHTAMKYIWRAAPMVAACLAVAFVAYVFSGNGILADRKNDFAVAEDLGVNTALSADTEQENTAITALGDQQKSMGVMGNEYIFDMTIDSNDPETLINEINAIIDEIVQASDDESFSEVPATNRINEIVLEVTPEQSRAILERIKEKYTDYTITERQADSNGMIRISINEK